MKSGMREEIVDYWNRRSDEYDASPGHSLSGQPEKAAWLGVLRELLPPPPPAEVLDVGTGTGFLALLLAEMGYEVTGIDLAVDMLARARAKATGMTAPPVFAVGDAADPPGGPKRFDALVCRHVVWTLVDPPTAFALWLQLLRPGGRLAAFDVVRTGDRPPGTPGYPDQLRAALPFANLSKPGPVLSALRSAGFAEVSARRLHEIERAPMRRQHRGPPP
ncbi:MAG: methyltransferase domain-containing protein, partial [Egibacteraceae bacterium]